MDRPLSAMATPDGASWTCRDCGVVARFDPPQPSAVPDGWAEEPSGWLCLTCRRESAIAGPEGESREERRTSRRRALMEFELLRDPSAPDGVIARRAKTSSATVKPVRADLRAAGRLPESGQS